MKVYPTEDIRNVVIVGHGSVGKTTFAEAALFVSGGSTRMGSVEDANTVSDYDEDERDGQPAQGAPQERPNRQRLFERGCHSPTSSLRASSFTPLRSILPVPKMGMVSTL